MLKFDFASSQKSSHFDQERNYSCSKNRFGVSIDWDTNRHYDVLSLEEYRLVGDIEMDRLLKFQTEKCSDRFHDVVKTCEIVYNEVKGCPSTQNDLSHHQRAMYEFYAHYHDCIPDWVDWDQIQRGIDVFVAFLPVASQALFYLSLVPGFAIPKIACVLMRTRYLAPPSSEKQVQTRLFDTGGFLLQCMTNENDSCVPAASLRPGASGWRSALEVRALHAKVRCSILKSSKNWDTDLNGIPINQEDMAATLLAFSVNVLNGIEFIAGRPLDYQSQADYLALWRYIGWLLGVETREENDAMKSPDFKFTTKSHLEPIDPCGKRPCSKDSSLIHSRATLESIIIHLMEPNETSIAISHHLLRIGGSKQISFPCLYRHIMCRWYIGNDLADALQLERFRFTFQHFSAFLLTYVVLIALRIYTNLTIFCQLFRIRVQKNHMKLQMKFLTSWKSKHMERMNKAARDAVGGLEVSSCPFALIMPATGEAEINKSM